MQTFLRGRDLIGDLDFSKEEVETVLEVAFDLKRQRALNQLHPLLRDKVLAMLFFFSSTRTRGSFEAGIAQLGGHGAFIESRTTQISHGDTPKEIGEIFGRYFDGIAIRVPLVTGSLADFTFVSKRPTSALEINNIFREAAKTPRWKGILKVVDEQIVSSDIIGDTYASIVDLSFTKVIDGDLVKVLAWYDNEWGYSAILIEHVIKAGMTIKK